MKYTIVFEWPDGQEPRIGPQSTFEGGRCCKVQFSDALAEIEELEEKISSLESECESHLREWERD
jgi:hypothetical protein